MREIYVEHEVSTDDWCVYDDNTWLASFRRREDAEEWAEQKRLEP